jgi:hypothetical protein
VNFADDRKPPLSPVRLAEFEVQLAHPLPQDYRLFLLQHNGGRPDCPLLAIPDCHDEAVIAYFTGIDRPNWDLIDWMTELEDDLAGQFLPIAFDPGGNAVLLDLTNGKIFYWDSARHFPCSSDGENTYWVADSFTQLVDQLRVFPQ